MEKKVEFIIDDSQVMIPDYIKNMTPEERETEIKKLEKEAKNTTSQK